MKKWIFFAVIILVSASLGYLHHSGNLDLKTELEQVAKKARELASNLAKDEAHAAPGDEAHRAHDAVRTAVAPAVSVATAVPRSFVERIMVTGSLVAREEILIAPEVEGLRVVTLEVEAGDTVAKGQVLATLERETLEAKKAQTEASLQRAEAAIAQAKSRIAQAEATLEEAEAQLARAEPLRKSKYLSESVYDQRKAAARTAQAQLTTSRDGVLVAEADKAQIEAQLRELNWNLTRTEIRAPADGLITRRSARIGDVASGTKSPMFILARDGNIELEAYVTEPKLARIATGQKAEVEIAGAGAVDGEVRLVSPEIDRTTRLGNVRIFLGKGRHLRVGAFGRGTLVVAKSSGLSVPLSAILFDNGEAFVQKVKDGKIATAPVTRGLTSGDAIEIKAGIEEGDVVVARAGTFLRSGDAVRPVGSPTSVSEAN